MSEMIDPEKIDMDLLVRRAESADRCDPDCWYDHQELETDSIADDLFIAAASPRVVTGLIGRIRELESELLGIAQVSEEEGWPDHASRLRVLVAKGTTQ